QVGEANRLAFGVVEGVGGRGAGARRDFQLGHLALGQALEAAARTGLDDDLRNDVQNRRDADAGDAPKHPFQQGRAGLARWIIAHMTDDSSNTTSAAPAGGQAMWGGRFSARPAELMQAINVSIGFDRRMAVQDLAGSRA